MSKNRTDNTIKNIAAALFVQLAITALSFVTRSVLIRVLGIQAAGLNGLFVEVIAILSLTEMGVGSAIIYNLYKPLSENDEKKVCQLMTLFRTAYNYVTVAVLVLGLLLTPFIQYLVKEVDYPVPYIQRVFLLFVLRIAASYLFGDRTSLLIADQRKYVTSVITLGVRVVTAAATVAVLYLTRSYMAYLWVQVLCCLGNNLAAAVYVRKEYPYLRKDRSLPKSERAGVFKNVKYLFVDSLAWKIVESTDNILISVLVSTLQVGYYSNYSVLFGIIRQLRTQVMDGIAGSLGNLLATEAPKHCEKVLNRMNYLFYVLGFLLCLGMFACVDPVVQLWLGEDFLLPRVVSLVCCLNLFLDICRMAVWKALAASGLFRENKNISIVGSVTNLVVSVILGMKLGMVGIFLGTTVTTLVQLTLKVRLLYREFFHLPVRKFVTRFCYYLLSFLAGEAGILWFMSAVRLDNLFLQVLANGTAAVALSIPFCVLVFLNTEEFRYALGLVRARLPFVKGRKQ